MKILSLRLKITKKNYAKPTRNTIKQIMRSVENNSRKDVQNMYIYKRSIRRINSTS